MNPTTDLLFDKTTHINADTTPVEPPSLISTVDKSNIHSLPLEHTFCMNKKYGTRSQIEQIHETIKNTYHSNSLKIISDYLVSNIILHDVPMSDYKLVLNGTNVCSGKITKSNYDDNIFDYTFDFTKKKAQLEALQNITKPIEKLIETLNIDISKYINLQRISTCMIVWNKQTRMYKSHIDVTLIGFKNDYKTLSYVPINETKPLYFNSLNFGNNPTDTIHLKYKVCDTLKPHVVLLRINGYDYPCEKEWIFEKDGVINKIISLDSQFLIDTYGDLYPSAFHWVQNMHLTDYINSNTINLSRIEDFRICYENVVLVDAIVNSFITYNVNPFHMHTYA